ncbi:TauD/TfdA family dioxygenase [Streptomyces litchfieldiae]|uniref:TauD/TfdA family dioxygenase n=1 Tax=Streptomyces litchfieldiae TaxID=3075543 RepID=A0ABU2MR26_9ACTN|nr:TauD/TfdA family dioxygenase [Streptomyces sp. DSM 44938]MDT0343965.1 TauD/TfdA family dioxygenase [Streptomyces sp. DSM 44938]
MDVTAPFPDTPLSFAAPDGGGPVLLRPPAGTADTYAWLSESRQTIDGILLRHGGVVLRDLGINSVSGFNKAVQLLHPDLLDYVNRSTPRTRLGGKLYTATEYPAEKTIALHNESSYTDVWPEKIFFYSAVVAAVGGETPVADSRGVHRRIDAAVREKFERTGVRYVRNFTAGIDLSWPEVFQTDDRSRVEEFCAAHGIDVTWRAGRTELTTTQVCQATVAHPTTGERVWFNQAHLFHLSALAEREQRALIDTLGEENVPRNAFYGDGEPIEREVLEHIRDVYEREKVVFPWRQGDIMLLDNLLAAHGRQPFQGTRKVVVAMG